MLITLELKFGTKTKRKQTISCKLLSIGVLRLLIFPNRGFALLHIDFDQAHFVKWMKLLPRSAEDEPITGEIHVEFSSYWVRASSNRPSHYLLHLFFELLDVKDRGIGNRSLNRSILHDDDDRNFGFNHEGSSNGDFKI